MGSHAQPILPEDCLRHCRRSMTAHEYELALLMIKSYGLAKSLDVINGSWIREIAADQGIQGQAQTVMIMREGLNILYAWLDKEFLVEDRTDAIGMIIAQQVWEHYKVPLRLVLGHLISEADEQTIDAALSSGRAAREKPESERKNFLRLVHSAPVDPA